MNPRRWLFDPRTLAVLALAGLLALYARPLATGFLADDYLFLEQARTRALADSIDEPGALGNYYRPLSRQVWFEALTPVAGGDPRVFHAASFVLFLAAAALLLDLLRALLPPAGALAGALYFALLPLQRVNLTWISCSQDLLALVGTLAALALARRGRLAPALLAYGAALASKESALGLPPALLAWSLAIERAGLRRALLRATPFAVLALAWVAIAQVATSFRGPPGFLSFGPGHFAAGLVHMAQSLAGLETAAGLPAALLENGPAPLALVLLAPLALAYEARARAAPAPAGPPAARVAAFAAAWLLAFGLVTGPAASTWSAYYYTLAAPGAAILVGLALRRVDRWTFLVVLALGLWWHAGATSVRRFALADRPWGWTSHLTSFYFERAAALSETLSRQLRALEPDPPPGNRFFFATLPPWAGFQMGSGALIRHLYADTTLRSYFYSQFSESTAALHPVSLLYWDGARLGRLYARDRSTFFHVGTDLLLLDRPAGAVHALRRGLAAGGDPMDHLYWLGFAHLWSGRRDLAESTWQRFGAVDDSLRWIAHLRAARNALVDGDSLEARRHLIRSIEFGIGRPEAHAVLGELLLPARPKYGTLELKVASWLKPEDRRARVLLIQSLADAQLDEPARRELAALARIDPGWRRDPALARLARRLGRSDPAALEEARF